MYIECWQHKIGENVECRSCDQILRVGFALLGIFPDITDRISSIAVGQ